MIGSSFPDATDSLTVGQGDPWCGSLLRELASALLATERAIGARVGNLSELGISGYTDWNSAFGRRARLEIGSFSVVTKLAAQAVSFADSQKFTSAPKVFMFDMGAGGTAQTRMTRVTSITTTGFTAYPILNAGETQRYLAVGTEWED